MARVESLTARLAPIWKQKVSPDTVASSICMIKEALRLHGATSTILASSSAPSAPSASAALSASSAQSSINTATQLLDRAYNTQTFTTHLQSPQVQHAVFVVDPKPDVSQCLWLLKNAGPQAYWISLRTALGRSQFLDAFRIIDMYPKTLPISIYPFAVGLASSTPWLPTPVAAIIAGCWIGLAIAAFSGPKLSRVGWKSNVSLKYRILHGDQLKMANMLVEYYEYLASTRIDNLIVRALDQRGFQILH